MHAAVIGTTVTTPNSVPFRLFVAETDILAGTGMVGGVPLESLEWEYAGSNSPAVMRFAHWDPPRAFSLPGRARVRFWSSADGDLFQGRLIGREADPAFASGRIVATRATDASVAGLDRNVVELTSFPEGLTDVDIIQGLCARFVRGSEFTWLASDDDGILLDITNVSMPAMTFQPQSLRSAFDVVATMANDDETLQRICYVDEKRRLRYGQQFNGGPAPYEIVDGTPAGGEKACTNLKLVDDDSAIITAVYVDGANAAGSGWVINHTNVGRYGWSAEILEAPDSDTSAKRNALGRSYLASRSQTVRRGSFEITGTTGWKADQIVTITSTSLGLSSSEFLIRHVTARPLTGSPTLHHTIEFGARRPSLVRLGWNAPETHPRGGR